MEILKKYDINVVGYDILKNVSDVEDYKTVKPSKIVCNGVLEHLTEEEIENTVKNFVKTRSRLKEKWYKNFKGMLMLVEKEVRKSLSKK